MRPLTVPIRRLVLPDLVEHDDGVVEREPEDREERDDRRGRDLEPGDAYTPIVIEDVVHHRGDRADAPS